MLKKFSQRAQWLAALVAIIFGLSLVSEVSAAALANGGFGSYPRCNLGGWTTSGTTYAKTYIDAGLDNTYNCVAQAYSVKPSGYTYTAISIIKQTFTIPAEPLPDSLLYSDYLALTAWGKSSNGYAPDVTPPFGTYYPQRITVYDANGNVIYSKSRNVNSSYPIRFSVSLSAYRGQDVTLEIKTTISSLYNDAPNYASIFVDNVHLDVGAPIPNCAFCYDW